MASVFIISYLGLDSFVHPQTMNLRSYVGQTKHYGDNGNLPNRDRVCSETKEVIKWEWICQCKGVVLKTIMDSERTPAEIRMPNMKWYIMSCWQLRISAAAAADFCGWGFLMLGISAAGNFCCRLLGISAAGHFWCCCWGFLLLGNLQILWYLMRWAADDCLGEPFPLHISVAIMPDSLSFACSMKWLHDS